MKILIIRVDRIGDLILSIPVLKAIKETYNDTEIGFVASEYAKDLIENFEEVDNFYLLKKDFSNYESILKEIIKHDYTHSITLQVDKKASWLPFKAKIPIRIGPYSKFSSFFMFNKGIIQKRSNSTQNEAEYNLALLKQININYKKLPISSIKPQFVIPKTVNKSELNNLPKKFMAIHPGMGNSALNTSYENYLIIATELSKTIPIVFTFGPLDYEANRFFSSHGKDFILLNELSLKELIYVYSKATAFIGPSTGPMHIAAAICKPKVFAIFSPIKVQSATRWAPWGSNATIIEPKDIICKEKYHCSRTCDFFNCVLNLPADNIIRQAKDYIGNIE